MRLSETRKRKLLTQWGLAKRAGVSQTKISLLENGYVIPSKEEIKKIANALGVKPNRIEWPPER